VGGGMGGPGGRQNKGDEVEDEMGWEGAAFPCLCWHVLCVCVCVCASKAWGHNAGACVLCFCLSLI